MEILGKILGSESRVKIMKLFLLNKSQGFKSKDISTRSRVNSSIVRRELKLLSSIHFIKKSSGAFLEWIFNPAFKYTNEFEILLIGSESLNKVKLLDKFKKTGRIKLLIVSGVFIKNNDSRIDLLIVGNNLKKNKIEEAIRKIESEVGVELVYAVFDTEEFIYRLNMYDKLVRDILDFPHEILLTSKEFSELSTLALKNAQKLV